MSKQVYVLSGSKRAKFITADEAATLTSARDDGRTWEVREGATKSDIVDGKIVDAPAAKPKSKSTKAKSAKPAKSGKRATAGSKGEWNGKTMCEVLRFCGKRGYTADQAEAVAKAAGFKAPMRSTVHMQLGYGRRGYLDVPELSKDEKAQIAEWAGDDAPAPKSKKSKKSKAAAAAD